MNQPDSIYLDYAAATPLDPAALKAAQPYLTHQFYNPSAAYQVARNVRQALDAARAQVADVLGSKDQEVVFTAGGTEANNLAIHGVMQQFPKGNIVVSAIEHESVLGAAGQYDCRVAPVTKKGIVDREALEQLIDDHTVLVSVMYANNEIGTIQPIKEIAAMIARKRTERIQASNTLPLYLHTDACQAANYLDLHVSRLGIDMVTLNGGKIYSLKQTGCLYVQKDVQLKALVYGGGQERSLRSGTENVAGVISFATMLQKVQTEKSTEIERISQIRDTLFATLSQKIPSLILNGDRKKRLPNNLSITIPGVDGERLLMELDEAGILVATGSACTASSDEPSHVLLALGCSREDASASLRITLGRQTTDDEMQRATETLATVIKKHQV